MEEKIFLVESRSATTAVYFSNGHILVNSQSDLVNSFVELNAIGNPIRITNYDGVELWRRNSENIFENIQPSPTIVTGYSIVNKFNQPLEEVEKQFYKDRFINRYNEYDSELINSLSANTDFNNPNQVNYAFFNDTTVDDYYASIFLHRTTKTLDTFNIYNNLIDSTPSQQSNYGVVFGKLEAIQLIKDVNGNNIRIPLRNVPIGIFNESNDFPSPTSQDDNGDRIFLNLRESSFSNEYFNAQSYEFDKQFLRSGSAFSAIPQQYKYITKTNDEGEFVIYDTPIGNSTLIFEVDLLKQGLTADEVALNFFPYPSSFDANVDQIPHFFFRQIPISVVPAWGDFQTGYTEVNIQANLDLKKWATFFITPLAANRNDDGTDGETVDERISAGKFQFHTVEIRDMSRDGFPRNTISVVEVEDMLDRVEEQVLEWRNEFAQRKEKATFRTYDYHAFKVPANMYDPNGFKRSGDGTPTSSKGVWLAGYQFKLYFTDKKVFRATGFHRLSPTGPSRNNFDLNKNVQDQNLSSAQSAEGLGVGIFPYDRKWDHTYPEPYSIPSIPKIINQNKTYYPQGHPSAGQPIDLSEPKYLDGDMVGSIVDGIAGGYGMMAYTPTGLLISTRFSQRVTKEFIYKYESGVTLDDAYTNGYIQGTQSLLGNVSIVAGGERWQRVECGHGYFLIPEGWPRVQNNEWGDIIYPYDSNPSTNQNIVNFESKDLALFLDVSSPVKEGCLNIYRIVNPSPENLISPDAPFVPTFTRFIIERVYRLQGLAANSKMHSSYNNSADNKVTADNRLLIYGTRNNSGNKAFLKFKLKITNNGIKSVKHPINPSQEIGIGDSIEIDSDSLSSSPIYEIDNNRVGSNSNVNNNPNNAFSFVLEGNSAYNFSAETYTRSNYQFEIIYNSNIIQQNEAPNNMIQDSFIFDSSNSLATQNTQNCFLRTSYKDVRINAQSTPSGPLATSNSYSSNIEKDIYIRGLILGVDNNCNSSFMNFSWDSTATNTNPNPQNIPTQNTLPPPPLQSDAGKMDEYINNNVDEFSTGWRII